MNDLDLEYRVSPRRKSIGIQVTTEGKVVVSLPRSARREDLARALAKHRAWIERQVALRRAAWDQLREGEAYFLGLAYRLLAVPGGRGAIALRDGALRVPGLELWPRLEAWYRAQAAAFIASRVRHFAGRMKLTPGPVALKGWKRRWGECHPDGQLRFNWRLILCPPAVIDYVVVHELAHLKVPGHNPHFWGLVARVLPDYAIRRGWLNQEGAPFLLWRAEL